MHTHKHTHTDWEREKRSNILLISCRPSPHTTTAVLIHTTAAKQKWPSNNNSVEQAGKTNLQRNLWRCQTTEYILAPTDPSPLKHERHYEWQTRYECISNPPASYVIRYSDAPIWMKKNKRAFLLWWKWYAHSLFPIIIREFDTKWRLNACANMYIRRSLI